MKLAKIRRNFAEHNTVQLICSGHFKVPIEYFSEKGELHATGILL